MSVSLQTSRLLSDRVRAHRIEKPLCNHIFRCDDPLRDSAGQWQRKEEIVGFLPSVLQRSVGACRICGGPHSRVPQVVYSIYIINPAMPPAVHASFDLFSLDPHRKSPSTPVGRSVVYLDTVVFAVRACELMLQGIWRT